MNAVRKPFAWIFKGIANALAPHMPPSPSASTVGALAPASAVTFRLAQGSGEGWLRVLDADRLIELVQGEKAIGRMWTQSRLASLVWQRDLLPALRRYAELVQLMPASEAHHHAHAGGLLAHTIEMVLAAMTWRNGHLLPEGATVEDMDAQRDEWTYVIFFAALLHDAAKVTTDLRITWRAKGMAEAVRWSPIAGTLLQVIGAQSGGEYHVDFTPKTQRDYQAHGRLAVLLLQQVAPASALSFLSRRPLALEALGQYLSGQDSSSLTAKIVKRADQASTQRALLHGSRARFVTSSSMPLIDLLMGSVKELLRGGTVLPLNRSGAAGWVHDDSIWFVAKRLADAVRQHLKQQAPDEAVPGENKNDRLFDTWQEYGCLVSNPATGQAIWHVTVVGQGAQGAQDDGAAYRHELSVLRFPLPKLFDSVEQHPPQMLGHIEVRSQRAGRAQGEGTSEPAPTDVGQQGAWDSSEQAVGVSAAVSSASAPEPAPVAHVLRSTEAATDCEAGSELRAAESAPGPGPTPPKPKPTLKAPTFNKPKAAPKSATVRASPAPPAAAPEAARAEDAAFAEPIHVADAPDALDQPVPPVEPAPSSSVSPFAEAADTVPRPPGLPDLPDEPPPAIGAPTDARPLLTRGRPVSAPTLTPLPVVLTPYLPELPHEAPVAGPASELAQAFIAWLQEGLATRRLKYNETGAQVHFVAEGMALVSPAVFKSYSADAHPEEQESAHGLQVQRAVLKAGWHLVGPGRINILSYQVLGRGGVMVSKLSAVVLKQPSRWVTPVPPNNPVLLLMPAA